MNDSIAIVARVFFLLLLMALSPLAAATGDIPFAFEPPAPFPENRPVPRLLFEAAALQPTAFLAAARTAARTEVEAIADWNSSGREPWKVGFLRPLSRPVLVEIDGSQPRSLADLQAAGWLQMSPEDGFTWVGRFEVADSSRLRLRLAALDLPADVEMLVYNEAGENLEFGLELADPGGDLWTPSVAGPVIFLEVHAKKPAAANRFEVNAVSEQFVLDKDGRPVVPRAENGVPPNTSCLVASSCVSTGTFPNIVEYRAAVAHIRYVKDGEVYICSASLLNDHDASGFIPYTLTANHCFSTQASASSLEAFWDYHESTCAGAVPNLSSLPRSNGSTLLATSAATDFTFLRLNSAAPVGAHGRYYLGSTSTPPSDGSSAYGIHHPNGWPQAYSRTVVERTPSGTCPGLPTSSFHYLNRAVGATFGGSSGSPLTTSGLQVIGQLYGSCAFSGEACLYGSNEYFVYGAFAGTYPAIAGWLAATGSTGCVDSPTTLCLLNRRFKIEATYRTGSGQTGPAKAVRLTEETGYFWFFNQTNIEAVFKLLNGCGLNTRYWVFAGGLTDVEVSTTITDTSTGAVRTFFNPLATPFQPIADTSAFATCP